MGETIDLFRSNIFEPRKTEFSGQGTPISSNFFNKLFLESIQNIREIF